MDNINYSNRSPLCSRASMYKEAGVLNWLKNTDYAKNLVTKLINPIQEKGLISGLGRYVGNQIIPKSYRAAVGEDLLRIKNEVTSTQQALKNLAPGTAEHTSMAKKLESLRSDLMSTNAKNQLAQDPNAYKTLWSNMMNSSLPNRERVEALKHLARRGGHYTWEGLNTALMTGLPAASIYSAATAPQGERWRNLGASLGEYGGLLAAGPIGIIPALVASPALGHVGSRVGRLFDQQATPLVSLTPSQMGAKKVLQQVSPGIKYPPQLSQYGFMDNSGGPFTHSSSQFN